MIRNGRNELDPQSAAEKAVSVIGLGYDLCRDIRWSGCNSRVMELDMNHTKELLFPGGVVVPNVPTSIKCHPGERLRLSQTHSFDEEFRIHTPSSGVEAHMQMDESVVFEKGLEDSSAGLEDEAACEIDDSISVDVDEGSVDIDDDDSTSVDVDEGSVDIDEGSVDDDERTERIINIDSMEDILSMDLKELSPHEAREFEFTSLDIAYEFYNRYARLNGFAVRKSNILRNNKKEILQRTFVCHRQGFREDRGLTIENRKRKCKPETRSGCEAKFRVHIDLLSQRWRITVFTDRHNHELLHEEYSGMLAAHRRMKESDIMQVNDMLKVGIGPSQVYGCFASQSGGYEKIGFRKKDIYNQIGKQRLLQRCDGKNALHYLNGLASDDPLMFYRHTIDGEGRLENLFWCDGISQMDYKVYGDVLAFDATYEKNKYHCPLVVFSGVNNHNHSIIFGGAIVAHETEETYVWVLEQFLEAVSGKSPISVITDGALAMKNAIKRVFPNAYHRLCAWHLIRNATSNVGIPEFVGRFRKCMLGDYEIGEFRRKWDEMVDTFKLRDNKWVTELYAKRKMWATAHIRGNFFAGFRTTSRCEGLHAVLGRFVNSRYNLADFLLHFHRSLNYMRYKEVEADFASIYGDHVLQTRRRSMERHAGKLFTREIFFIFRDILERSADMVVTTRHQTYTYFIYTVCKYQASKREWKVSFYPYDNVFKCSCKRMESFGLPCEHIVALLVLLDIAELPETLVAARWTKNAKEATCSTNKHCPKHWDTDKSSRYCALMFRYMRLSKLVSESGDDFNEHMEQAAANIRQMETKRGLHVSGPTNSGQEDDHEILKDPAVVRSKGCTGASSSRTHKKRKQTRCSTCGKVGHNKQTCSMRVRERRGGRSMDRRRSPPRYRTRSRSRDYYSPPPKKRESSRSASPGGRRYSRERSYSQHSRERSYSRSPPYNGDARSRSQSPSKGPGRSRSPTPNHDVSPQ